MELATLVELSGQYPLIRYSHKPSDDRELPLALRDLMELTTLCRALLDPEVYPSLAAGPSVRAAHRLGLHFLGESEDWASSDPATIEDARRSRYEKARRRLEAADVKLREDPSAWNRFNDLNSAWDLKDVGMREGLGYPTQ